MNKDSLREEKLPAIFLMNILKVVLITDSLCFKLQLVLQLKKIDKMVKERRKIANEYIEKLFNIENISIFQRIKIIIVNWQSFPDKYFIKRKLQTNCKLSL